LKNGLECVRDGVGHPIVLVPGLQGDPGIFSGLMQHLAPARPLWTFRLGSGGLVDDAQVLQANVTECELEAADIVAGSYGGHVALKAAVSFRSIVLTGSFPKYEALPAKSRLSLMLSLRLPVSLLHTLYTSRFQKRLINDGVPAEVSALLKCPTGLEVMTRLRSLENLNVGQARVPLLWLAGREDSVSAWTQQALQETWPGASVDRVPGKHRPYASHPEAFSARVEEWWRETQSSPAKS
jgi:pimeloyl-ACP methyl ester carboxylesterase